MVRPIHLERVSERFIIELSLKLDRSSPLLIGAGSEGTRKLLLMFHVNGKSLPIIPAESLKGVLRSLASSLFKQIFPGNFALKYHANDRHVKREGLKEDERREIENLYLGKAREYLKNIMPRDVLEAMALEDKLQLLDYYFALNCPVCKLFGTQGMAGKLTFSDGIPSIPPKLFTYMATSINRKTKTVEGERLFSLTAVGPDDDLRYRVKVIADNVHKGSEEAKLLSALLRWILKLGLQIGGLKSYGYGKLSIDEHGTTVKLFKFSEDPLNNVRALLLEDGYFQAMNIDELARWLE